MSFQNLKAELGLIEHKVNLATLHLKCKISAYFLDNKMLSSLEYDCETI